LAEVARLETAQAIRKNRDSIRAFTKKRKKRKQDGNCSFDLSSQKIWAVEHIDSRTVRV